jgi:hypothetical protein
VVPLAGCWYQFEDQVYGFDTTGLANPDARLILVVGAEDDVCHAWQSEQATEALRTLGYDVELIEIEQGDHFTVVEGTDGPEVVTTILDAIEAARAS